MSIKVEDVFPDEPKFFLFLDHTRKTGETVAVYLPMEHLSVMKALYERYKPGKGDEVTFTLDETPIALFSVNDFMSRIGYWRMHRMWFVKTEGTLTLPNYFMMGDTEATKVMMIDKLKNGGISTFMEKSRYGMRYE